MDFPLRVCRKSAVKVRGTTAFSCADPTAELMEGQLLVAVNVRCSEVVWRCGVGSELRLFKHHFSKWRTTENNVAVYTTKSLLEAVHYLFETFDSARKASLSSR
jgi:hypothetical protein